MSPGAASRLAAGAPADTADRSLAHWSEAGRAEMEAFYTLAGEDYRQLALAADWPALLGAAAERFVAALAPGGLGFVAQATAGSHYLVFYDAYRAGVRAATPYTSAEQVRDALRTARSPRASCSAAPSATR